MPVEKNFEKEKNYLILISFLGLFLIISLTFFPPILTHDNLWRKPIIGSIFGLICILGSFAVFSPTHCSRIFKKRKKVAKNNSNLSRVNLKIISYSMEGHHFNCGNFSAHIFEIKGRVFCAACVGLLIGAILTLILTFLYFFINLWFFGFSTFFVLVGVLGIVLGLFQYKFKNFFRLLLNILFVFGAFFILIGIDELIQSLMINFFVVSLIAFWLYTRIILSQWDHNRICSDCEDTVCKTQD